MNALYAVLATIAFLTGLIVGAVSRLAHSHLIRWRLELGPETPATEKARKELPGS